MISFDKVSESRKIVSAVNMLVHLLKNLEATAYLFGSATWRLPTNQFDEGHDLDFLIDINYEKKFMDVYDFYCRYNNIKYSYEEIVNFESMYVQNLNKANDCTITKHIRLTLNKTFGIDLIFTSDIKKSILNINDIDNGLLIYNLSTDKYEVAGLPTDISVQYLLDICSSRKITTKYIKKYSQTDTTFCRIIKMIKYGFTYDIDEIYDIALSSLVTSQFFKLDYFGKSYLSAKTQITRTNRIFYNHCLTSQAYEFVKQCYIRKSSELYMPNKILFTVINYAIYMNDFDFAFSLGNKLDLLEPNVYFPMLIRRLDDFDLTKKFLSFFSKYSTHRYFDIDVKRAKQLFSYDALKSNDKIYYEQLVKFDKDYEILE
jgi:hypothetical protein